MRIYRTVTIVLLLFFGITSFAQDSLRLEKIVVVSRHGLRAPLQDHLDTLDSLTSISINRELWRERGVKDSELTLKGSALENLFGEYFRMWFNSLGFQLQDQEVYFGASSKQRTIATARSFAAGMLPLKTVPVYYKQKEDGNYGYLDENYLPLFYGERPKNGMIFDTVAFQDSASKKVDLIKIEPSFGFLEEVLQYSDSPRAKAIGSKHFNTETKVNFDFYKLDNGNIKKLEPTLDCDLNVANKASDALILMYYEFPDSLRSFFKRDFSFDDMCKIASVKDQYGRKLFTAPIVAVNVSHCMLKNIYAEMNCNWHKFTFLCTHDSMIQSLLAALRVENYELKSTIEKDTPIGVKLLLEEWVNPNNCERYIKAELFYQSTEQIQKMQVLDLKNHPQFCELSFTGLEKEENGMYDYDAFMKHIEKTLDAYKRTAVGKHPWE